MKKIWQKIGSRQSEIIEGNTERSAASIFLLFKFNALLVIRYPISLVQKLLLEARAYH